MKNFLIYRSSAGSGKTYTLVKEYLKLILSDPSNYKSTLAVTFTNKAADEMKSRILSSLKKLWLGSDPNLAKQLSDEGVKGDIPQKAKAALQNILHKYSYFSVSTIDSFFHKIIRAFGKELKQHLGYRIELDHKMVMDKIVEELLDEIGTDKELTKYIEDYIFYSIDENTGWKIDHKIKDLAGEIFTEKYWIKRGSGGTLSDNREKMEKFVSILVAIINDFEGKMKGFSENALMIISDSGLEIRDFKNGTASYFVKLLKKDNYPGGIEPGKIVQKLAGGNDNWYSQKSDKKELIKKASDTGLQNLLVDAISLHEGSFKKYNTAKELIKTVHVLGIFKDLMKRLAEYRDENKLMLISDTNNMLMKVISGDNSPFVYEKIGNVYRNFLIDEFQDTSTFQWKNFLPLVENSISENNFSMIVGDVKQSIYRWRNGNMKLLLEGVYKDLLPFKDLIEEKFLQENFRSRENIIKFNNDFFTSAPGIIAAKNDSGESSLITDSYKDAVQNCHESSSGGYVNISFISPTEEDDLNSRELSIRKTIETVKNTLESGYSLRDVLILTRKNSDAGEIAHYLMDAGYQVVSNDSLLLTNSPKVKLIVNLLKYIVDNKNYLAKTEILYTYLVYIRQDATELNKIFNDFKNTNDPLFNRLLPSGFFEDSHSGTLNHELHKLNIYELVEKLISIFELNDTFNAYLVRFIEAVRELSGENHSDIPGFIDWWEENKSNYSIIIPEEEDAIRIMTVHKAKGLQSPIVIMPYANWSVNIDGTKDLIWASSSHSPFNESSAYLVKAVKGLENSYFAEDYNEEAILTNLDNLNLMYVAFTRAIERLYILVPVSKSNAYRTGKLIEETLNSNEELKKYFNGVDKFELGTPGRKQAEQKASRTSYLPGKLLSTDFCGKAGIKSNSKDVTIETEKKYEELRNRGIIIHKALSYINYPEDVGSAIARLRIEGLITINNEEKLTNDLEEILKINEVKKWFSRDFRIRNEAEMLDVNGDIYKPDRILLKDEKAIVIDYKTGRHKKEHIEQVNGYARILNKMGYKEIEKYLFYVPERKIVKI